MKEYKNLFTPHNQKILILFSLLQFLLGLLDLLGVALVGAVGALSIRGLTSKSPGNQVSELLKVFHIQQFSIQSIIIILSLTASVILISKTFISMFVAKKILKFVSETNFDLSRKTIAKVFTDPISKYRNYSQQEIIYYTTDGIENLTLGIVGTLLTLVADVAVLAFLTIGLMIVDLKVTTIVLVMFISISVITMKKLNSDSRRFGDAINQISIKTNTLLIELEKNQKALVANGRLPNIISSLQKTRFEAANLSSEKSFIPMKSKYIVEGVVIFGIIAVTGLQFVLNSPLHAIGSSSVFLAAVTRISPAILRLQQGAILIKGNIAAAKRSMNFLKLVDTRIVPDIKLVDFTAEHHKFLSEISVENVDFQYDKNEKFRMVNVNLNISDGDFLAIVGKSGSGKSTLVDLILGVSKPDKGKVTIGNLEPRISIMENPGAICYVPQESVFIDGSIRENLAVGLDSASVPDHSYWWCLEEVGLKDFVLNLSSGLETHLGTAGIRLSGGQLQRLAIARALLTRPRIMILDEPTSALDRESEEKIIALLNKMKGKVTIILIAHRGEMLKLANRFALMDTGSLTIEYSPPALLSSYAPSIFSREVKGEFN
jgi:ATP-binding cassette subfamily C protein